MSPSGTPSKRLGWLPAALALLLGAFALCPRVQRSEHLWWAFVGVSAALVGWWAALRLVRRARGGGLETLVIPPVRQHYIQACVQLVLYGYWGWMWVVDGVRPIFDQAPLIVAQFVYLYAFDGLWQWSRGRPWRLASGPMPIVLSTNLFIWFRDDWFVWQFAMITAGLLGKEFLRWDKDGRRTHIFNPSGFGLMCAATVLVVTGTTDVTWAKPLASEIEVRHIFVVLFALGLVVQFFFAVTLMTFAAALVMIACNLLYTEVTGVYLFASSNLPAAAFLGLMLLMTDPSTSPRTNVGRAIFGAGYGLGYVVFYQLLGSIGAPELYAKLYPVPILNCTVQLLDRLARRGAVGRLNERWERGLPATVTNGVHMALWASVFAVMFFSGYVEGPHPGNSIGFWKRARAEGRHEAERKLVMVTGSRAVAANVPPAEQAAAYNELGILSMTADDGADDLTRRKSAARWFAEGAARGSDAAVVNLVQHFLSNFVHRSDAELNRAMARCQQLALGGDAHAAALIGVAVEYGAGVPPDPGGALTFYRRGPAGYAWTAKGIARVGLRRGAVVDLAPVAAAVRAAADAGDAEACYYLAYMHDLGRGVGRDPERATALLARAAALGFAPAADAAGAPPAAGRALPPFAPPRRKHLGFPPWATAFPLIE